LEKIQQRLRSWAAPSKDFFVLAVINDYDGQLCTEPDDIKAEQFPKRAFRVRYKLVMV
jgi:hypothetical protein